MSVVPENVIFKSKQGRDAQNYEESGRVGTCLLKASWKFSSENILMSKHPCNRNQIAIREIPIPDT